MINNTEIRDLQFKILEIVKYFDQFCRENEITYYLMGGSALGAIRHNGFIPWDDDLDVFMTRDNYVKLLDSLERKMDRNLFHLQRENSNEWPMFFSKLRLNGTTFIEKDTMNSEIHQGVYIDIMCLYYSPSNKYLRFFQYLSALFLTANTLALRGYNSVNDNRRRLAMYLAKLIVSGKIKTFLFSIVSRYSKDDCDFVGHYFGKARFMKTGFPKKWLGNPRYVKFENLRLPVPAHVEEYLVLRYGEKSMDLPDERTKAKYPIHAYYIDLERDYKEYMANGKFVG